MCIQRLNWQDIHHEVKDIYGKLAISCSKICLCKQFKNGPTNLTDEFCERQHLNITIPEKCNCNQVVYSRHKNPFY